MVCSGNTIKTSGTLSNQKVNIWTFCSLSSNVVHSKGKLNVTSLPEATKHGCNVAYTHTHGLCTFPLCGCIVKSTVHRFQICFYQLKASINIVTSNKIPCSKHNLCMLDQLQKNEKYNVLILNINCYISTVQFDHDAWNYGSKVYKYNSTSNVRR